jgi:hypothetical protein
MVPEKRDEGYRTALGEVLAGSGRFGHREHLMLAWSYLRSTDPETSELWMRSAIRHLAAVHGTPDKYHETLTLAWTRLVAAHLDSCDRPTFAEFMSENPALLDAGLPERHFSPTTLWGARARREWVEPDLSPLPSPRDPARGRFHSGE